MLICMGVLIFLVLLSCLVEMIYENQIDSKYAERINIAMQTAIAIAFILWIIVMIADLFYGVF